MNYAGMEPEDEIRIAGKVVAILHNGSSTG